MSEVGTVLGLDISASAVYKFLKKIGFTHHKLETYALQRDDTLCQQYVTDVSTYPCETLLYADETRTNRKDAIRNYGYSLQGYNHWRPKSCLCVGSAMSGIAAMSMQGIEVIKIATGSVDGDAF